jgi:hypothetical protein
MGEPKSISKHSRIQHEIVSACNDLGIKAIQEFTGNGWRADVFIPDINIPIAFEIQLSQQSLNKTLERQSKYIKDGILGCWLFQKPIPKLIEERPDLPVFFVDEKEEAKLIVSLADRRHVILHEFLESFIKGKIRFNKRAITKRTQHIKLVFLEMECWKCHEMNHIYYVDNPFYSACNVEIQPDEAMWESNSIAYHPEIVALAESIVKNTNHINLKLGPIKKRYSNTIQQSYTSFGCCKCDSIFGDWYIMEAVIDSRYEPNPLTFVGDIELHEDVILNIPHWCYPDNHKFCDD